MTRADELLNRVVGLLEQLDDADPWAMTRDELEELLDDAGSVAGELLEERRRQTIIAAAARPYDYS